MSTGAAYVSGPVLVLVPAVIGAGIVAAPDAFAAGGFRDLLSSAINRPRPA